MSTRADKNSAVVLLLRLTALAEFCFMLVSAYRVGRLWAQNPAASNSVRRSLRTGSIVLPCLLLAHAFCAFVGAVVYGLHKDPTKQILVFSVNTLLFALVQVYAARTINSYQQFMRNGVDALRRPR